MAELEESLAEVLAGRPAFVSANGGGAGPSLPHLVVVLDGGRAERSDLLTRPLAGVTVLLLAVGALAALLPALRASRSDPAMVMRETCFSCSVSETVSESIL